MSIYFPSVINLTNGGGDDDDDNEEKILKSPQKR